MTYFDKSQVRQAIQGGIEQGFSGDDVVNEMLKQGHQLEGLNAPETRREGAYPNAERDHGSGMGVAEQTAKQTYNAGNELYRIGKQIITKPGPTIGGIVKTGIGILEETAENISGGISDLGEAVGLDIPRLNIPTFRPDGSIVNEEDTPEQQMAKHVATTLAKDYGIEKLAQGDIPGALSEIEQTLYEAPLSSALDIIGLGSTRKTLKTGELPSIPKRGPKPPRDPGILKTVAKDAGDEFLNKSTGLNRENIKTIVRQPEMYAAAEAGEITRGSLANSMKQGIDQRLKELGETGAGYETIRRSDGVVKIPDDVINKVMKKYGLEVTYPDGKIRMTAESRPLSAGDINGIEEFIRTYGSYKNLSRNGFLNARESLSKLSDFDVSRTDVGNQIARDLREAYNGVGRPQIPDLATLDLQYAPEVSLLRQLKKEYLTTIVDETGRRVTTLKDNAISRIMGATNKGRDEILRRLEKIDPNIGEEIRVLKALEDVELASQNKIGSYFRSGLALGAGGGVIFGTGGAGAIPLLATAIITSPKVIARILQWYGKMKKNGDPAGIMLKMKRGAQLEKAEKAFVQDAVRNYEKSTGKMDEIQGRVKALNSPDAEGMLSAENGARTFVSNIQDRLDDFGLSVGTIDFIKNNERRMNPSSKIGRSNLGGMLKRLKDEMVNITDEAAKAELQALIDEGRSILKKEPPSTK